jgi:hypothetical protein
MIKTALIGFLIWSWALITSLAVVFSMILWALGQSLPFLDSVKWTISAHLRDKW